MRYGIDVSQYQGRIDWEQVRAARIDGNPVDFALIRAMMGLRFDERVLENLTGARGAGLVYGVYHVVHEAVAGADQAEELLDFLSQHYPMALPVMLDIERPLHAGSSEAHRATLFNAQIIARMLQEEHYRVGIYTGAWWWNPASAGMDVVWAEALDLWVATYGTTRPILPCSWRQWRFWQYTSSGRLAGIAGKVDLDVFDGDLEAYVGETEIPTIFIEDQLDVRIGDQIVARIVARATPPEPPVMDEDWVLPVGTPQYPVEKWGVRGYTHDLRTTDENPNRRNGKPWPHSGYDINLDVAPYGDIERGFPVVAMAHGIVHYVTEDWSGVGMCVIIHFHEDWPLYVRYAHITVAVKAGDIVESGQVIGTIADYPNEGDHLHLDMALDPFTREWVTPVIRWIDPAEILKAHIDPVLVGGMLRVGD